MFSQIAEKHNKTPAQVVLRWSLQKGFVPLPKSDTPSRIQANRDLYDFVLDDDDMRNLGNLDRGSAGAVTWNPVNAP
jgi:diketogulonate reductase-like aldo/keto reductase